MICRLQCSCLCVILLLRHIRSSCGLLLQRGNETFMEVVHLDDSEYNDNCGRYQMQEQILSFVTLQTNISLTESR